MATEHVSDISGTAVRSGPTSRMSRASPKEWLNPLSVTLTSVIVVLMPYWTMLDTGEVVLSVVVMALGLDSVKSASFPPPPGAALVGDTVTAAATVETSTPANRPARSLSSPWWDHLEICELGDASG